MYYFLFPYKMLMCREDNNLEQRIAYLLERILIGTHNQRQAAITALLAIARCCSITRTVIRKIYRRCPDPQNYETIFLEY